MCNSKEGFFWGKRDHVASGILIPQPGTEPVPSTVEAWSLNCWTTKEILPRKCIHFYLFSHCVWLFVTPWTAAQQTSLSLTNSWSLPKFMSVKLVMPSNHLISVTLFSFCLQSSPASESFPLSQLVKVLELQLQHRSFQKVFRVDLL